VKRLIDLVAIFVVLILMFGFLMSALAPYMHIIGLAVALAIIALIVRIVVYFTSRNSW
jgi:hypothetical protein